MNFERGGERGIAILVVPFPTNKRFGGDGWAFILQHRIVDFGFEAELNIQCKGAVSRREDLHIRYCPFCGRHLGWHYRSHLEEMYRPGLV